MDLGKQSLTHPVWDPGMDVLVAKRHWINYFCLKKKKKWLLAMWSVIELNHFTFIPLFWTLRLFPKAESGTYWNRSHQKESKPLLVFQFWAAGLPRWCSIFPLWWNSPQIIPNNKYFPSVLPHINVGHHDNKKRDCPWSYGLLGNKELRASIDINLIPQELLAKQARNWSTLLSKRKSESRESIWF